jgi:hypothetical protein
MARFELEGPDGARYEVEAPDAQSAVAAFKKMTAAQAPAAVNQGIDAPLHILQRGNRLAADVLGAPVDLATGAVNVGLMGADALAGIFGGSVPQRLEKPFLGSEWIADRAADAYEGVGGTIVDPETVSPGVRVAGEALRFGGGALLGGVGLASRAGQAASQAPGVGRRVLGPLAAPYAQSSKPIVGDAAAGVGAGAAVGTYEEAIPEAMKDRAGPVGPLLAALVGGATGATGAATASGARRLAVNAKDRVLHGPADPHAPVDSGTDHAFRRGEMDEAARMVQAQASNPATAAENVGRSVRDLTGDVRSGEMPTTGAASDDVGLALLEREARIRDPRQFIERDRASNARAGDLVARAAPADAEARAFTDSADLIDRARVAAAQGDLHMAREADAIFATARRAYADDVASNAGQRPGASMDLDREIVDNSLRPMQERKNTAFDAIDPSRSVERDAAPLIVAARRIRDSLGRLNDPANVLPTRTLDRIDALSESNGGLGTITFAEINALRPELSSALTKARASGDFALADNIQALQSAIGRETDRLAAEATPAGRRAAEAQRIYSEEFAPVWNVGPGDEARRFRRDVNSDRLGRTLSPPSGTAGRFLVPGQPEKAESLRRIFETLPDRAAAEAQARRFLVSDLAESGVADAGQGALRPDAIRRWRDRWGNTLDVVPGLRDEIADLLRRGKEDEMRSGKLAREVKAAESRFDDAVRNKGALGLALGKDPINAVSSIFGSPDPERAMAAIVGQIQNNKRAFDGLKASVVDYLTDQTTTAALQRTADGSRPVDFARLEDVFNRHEKTLANVFSADEMHSLRQAHRLLKPQQAVKLPGGSPSFHESEKSKQAWRLLEGGLKAKWGVLKGGGLLRTVRIFVEALPNKDQAVQDLIVRFHFDPELAQHLLTRAVEITPQWNAKLNRLLATLAGARSFSEED